MYMQVQTTLVANQYLFTYIPVLVVARHTSPARRPGPYYTPSVRPSCYIYITYIYIKPMSNAKYDLQR